MDLETEENASFPRKEAPELSRSKSIEFQIIDIFIPEADKAAQYYDRLNGYPRKEGKIPQYEIILYGVTDEGYSIACTVKDFYPYFYLKCPDKWEKTNTLSAFQDSLLNSKIKKKKFNRVTKKYEEYQATVVPYVFQDHIESIEFVSKKDYWGFTNRKNFKFIKFTVKSLGLFNNLKKWFGDADQKSAGWKLYGSNLDPFLKFIHERKIEPCGWVKVEKGFDIIASDAGSENEGSDTSAENNIRHFRTHYNIEASKDSIIPRNYKKIAPLLIVSVDIECTSSHGDFPVAKKDYRKLATDLIVAAKENMNYFKEHVKQWLSDCFIKDIPVSKNTIISRVYPINDRPSRSVPIISDEIVSEVIRLIIDIVNKKTASKTKGSGGTCDDGAEDGGNEGAYSDDDGSAGSGAEPDKTDKTLIEYLTNKCGFPKLQGDAIIQIGSTVSRFGSDKILYKHIVCLNKTDEVKGIDLEYYNTEIKVIKAWKEFIQRLDPDIITGYNIFGFDMKYIWERCEELNYIDSFSVNLGRMLNRKTILDKKELSSSALGENIMYFFDMDGVVQIDMLKVMQRDHKLDSFKLDFVAQTFLKDKKDDISPREIFEKFLGNSEDRAVIAKYCVQDCALCNRLMHKLKVIGNNIAMGNVCSVPLAYLFMRGQSIKIFSLVSRECHHKDYVIPVVGGGADVKLNMLEDTAGYEGAIVLEPKCDMYLDDPITVFDYSSLYPSCMISRNLSHDAFVNDPAYANIEGVEYVTIEYDIYEGTGDKKKVIGKKTCVFAQFPNGEKGVLPTILMNLLKNRKNTRLKIEYQTFTMKDGKEIIGYVNENDLKNTELTGYKVLDVDSGDKTDILVSEIISAKDTFTDSEKSVLDAQQLAYKITANSLYGQTGSRYSAIYLKEIAACTTATGREMIYLAKNFMEKTYNVEVVYGDSVMPYTPILLRNKITGEIITKTIDSIDNTNWKPYDVFKAGDSNRREKQQIEISEYETWTDNGWSSIKRVIKHKSNHAIYRILTDTGLVDVTEDHSLLSENKEIIKPTEVNIGTKLLCGFPPKSEMSSEISSEIPIDKSYTNDFRTTKSHIEAQNIYMQMKPKGDVIIDERNGTIELFYMEHYNKNFHSKGFHAKYIKKIENLNAIKRIEKLYDSYDDYVYDLETEEGNFQAGIGNIIVKNTDSIFCKFPLDCPKEERLQKAIHLGIAAEKAVKAVLPAFQSLAYEKVLFPLILLSKKRYIGNLYEKDPKKFKEKSMGVVTKRRDNAHIVKIVYGGIIQILLNKNNLEEAVEFLQDKLQDLIDGKIPLENLIISKTLRSTYKDPTKIAHKVLADRMGDRDIGNKPMVNDRVPYIYIKTLDANGDVPKLQGDRIEHPDYIREQNLTPDYYHYITNQILKPVCQLFALCLTKLPGYSYPPEYWEQIDEELLIKDLYKDEKKRQNRIETLRNREVENLLFEKFLKQLQPTKVSAATKRKLNLMQASGSGSGSGAGNGAKIEEIDNALHIKCTQIKKGKEYSIDFILKNKDKELWKQTYIQKYTKEKSIAIATQKAFRHIMTMGAIDDIGTIDAMIINVDKTDKKFVDEWKKSMKESNNLKKRAEDITATLDTGACNELQEDYGKYENLIEWYNVITYDWKIIEKEPPTGYA